MDDYHSNATPGTLSHQVELEWPSEYEATLQPHSLCSFGPQNQQSPSAGPRTTRAARNSTFLRLTVLSSSVLPPRGVALIDSYDEVSIGRDRCETPRLRLKELAVSKYHANIYCDSHTQLWSLVDVGSTHGTNLVSPESPEAQLSGTISSLGYNLGNTTRLSPPKMSSLPRPLSHLQHIVIGGTTLVVHMHLDQVPCDACTIVENNLISLETSKAGPGAAVSDADRNEPAPNSAKSLKDLRRSLLSRPSYSVSAHAQAGTLSPSGPYVDRAELRRQRFPGWRDVDARREVTPSRDTLNRRYHSRAHHGPPLTDDVSTRHLEAALPIPLSNVGHRLLAKQGWKPGSTLGSQSDGDGIVNALAEPLVLQGTHSRRGLGMNRK